MNKPFNFYAALLNIVYATMFVLFVSACQSNESSTSTLSEDEDIQLGELNFKVTGDDVAQDAFKKGLLLLHSFEYADARESFLEAQQKDSLFLMAYWGEAMTYNHSLWQKQENEKGDSIVNKLKILKASNQISITPLETDFINSLEVLYGDGTKYERDQAYSKFLKNLCQKYPKNHEVSAFHAISLLGASRNGRDDILYGKSAEIAQGILKENPNHPGALHYLIHSFDDPVNAPLAKKAADKYSKVAPDAAHALHMPSHIYVALGQWNDVVNSNIASWNASMKKKESDSPIEGSYHALNWLQYGLLQRGEVELATELLYKMKKYTDANPSKKARSYFLAMKGAHLVETNTWEGTIADINIKVDDLPLIKRAGNAYINGMRAFHKKDKVLLSEIMNALKQDKYAAGLSLGDKTFAMCSSGGYENKPPNELDLNMVSIIEMELQAASLLLTGNEDQAIGVLQTASQLDNTLSYSAGPPLIFKPVTEAYAELLAANKQHDKAATVFEKSLKRNPRRLHSLKGAKQTASVLNNSESLAKVNKELQSSLKVQQRNKII